MKGAALPAASLFSRTNNQNKQIQDGTKGEIEVTCLIASEINVPEGVKPVVWGC